MVSSELNISEKPVHSSPAPRSRQQQRPQARSEAPTPTQADSLLQAAGQLAGQDSQSLTPPADRNRMRTYRKGDSHGAAMRPSNRENRSPSDRKRDSPPSRSGSPGLRKRIRDEAPKGYALATQLANSDPLSTSETPGNQGLVEELTKAITERLDTSAPSAILDERLTAPPQAELRARDVNLLLGANAFRTIPKELSQASRIQPVVEQPRSTANPTPSVERQVRAIRKARRVFGLDPSSRKDNSIPIPQKTEHSVPGMEQKWSKTPDIQIHLSALPGALKFKREQIGGDYKPVLQLTSHSSRPVLDTVTCSLAVNGSMPPEARAETIRVVERLTPSS